MSASFERSVDASALAANDANVAHLLATPLTRNASAVAISNGTASAHATTFAELDAMAWRMFDRLRADGLTAGQHVLFFAPPSAQLYAALIAVWRIGAVGTFVDPSAGRTVLDAACVMCTPAALIASPKAQLLRLTSVGLRAVTRTYVVDGWAPFTRRLDMGMKAGIHNDTGTRANSHNDAPTRRPRTIAAVSDNAPALLTFTSGSTGVPKGAIRTHGILRAQLAALTNAFATHPKQCELVALPIVVLLNLANGVSTVLPNADLRTPGSINAEPVLRQLRESATTSVVAAPAFLERLVVHANARAAFERIDAVITGGGPVFPDLVSRITQVAPRATVIAVYGSTEAEPIAHVAHSDVSVADMELMQRGGGLLAGVPVPDVQLTLIRVSHENIAVSSRSEFDELAVAPGEAGEIVVTGDHVVKGYWGGNGDSETKIRVDDTIWHRTGDLGRQDTNGRLWLLGRLDAYANDSRGAFYPFAVECAARTIPGVHRSAAFAHTGRRVLVIVANDGVALNTTAVQQQLHWAQLDDVRLVKALPMDKRHNSKVNYAELRKQLGISNG